ncbi:peroxide stress protein YaaA-like protein [Skeletonema marinoi]|uniref:Peroxide stress protein YaaA-like protein n=1 Tax=Skeletonema marinoi TaxID=267567 RepID=A0AAD8Y3D6_9STRA|nr:peroxide stress protein YaaA-like protein [Skeletonema marinoi]
MAASSYYKKILSSLLLSQQATKALSFATMTTVDRGIAMVISPAKTLDLQPLHEREDIMVDHETIAGISSAKHTSRCDQDKTNEIVNIMKMKSEAELKSLLSLSPSLSKTAYQYWQDFSIMDSKKRKDDDAFAIFTFNGPAFQGISAHQCNKTTLSYMAQNLFVLDAVFGVLRSLDTLQPYRLEMGCKGVVATINAKGKKETLASYWKESVTSYLGKELLSSSKGKAPSPAILANLASDEYSSSIDVASLPPNTIYINAIFRHQGRVLAVHAKRARGLMARYLSDTNAQTLEDVSNFNLENYNCIDIDDEDNKWEVTDIVGDNVQVIKMIFDRNEAPPKAGKRTAAPSTSSKKGGKKAKKK